MVRLHTFKSQRIWGFLTPIHPFLVQPSATRCAVSWQRTDYWQKCHMIKYFSRFGEIFWIWDLGEPLSFKSFLLLLEEQQKSRWRGKWDIRVWFPSRDEESDEWFLDDKTTCDDDNIPSLEQEAPFHYGWFSPVWKKCLLQQQNCVQLIFLYFPFYGTNGIAVKFCCYTLLFTLLFVSLILTCFYWGSLIGSLILRSRLKFCLSPVIPMDYTG